MINLSCTRRLLAPRVCALLAFSIPGAGAKGNPNQTAQGAQPRRDAHVVMISIDGLVPDYYLEPARLGLKVPNLLRMKLGGAYAEGVEGIFPTVTYPAHTTMI